MSTPASAHYHLRLLAAVDYIESHPERPLRLDDIARAAHLSKFHFHRVFKAVTGTTVGEYVARVRLSRAAILLRGTELPIRQLYARFGYRSAEQFSRAFAHRFGESPSKWRVAAVGTPGPALSGFTGPRFERLGEIRYARRRVEGDYDALPEVYAGLIAETAASMPSTTVAALERQTIGIVRDDPGLTEVDQLRFDAGVCLPRGGARITSLHLSSLPRSTYAVYSYVGPYDELRDAYDAAYRDLVDRAGWQLREDFVVERYRTSPLTCTGPDFHTELCVPIVRLR